MIAIINTYPLSHSQQGIWLHQQQAPQSVVYNTSLALRILSAFNLTAFRQTLKIIVNRHAAFRTVIYVKEGQPIQHILAEQVVAFTQIDATGWDEERLRTAVLQAHRSPYDFAQGPLFRVHLFTKSSQRHILLLGAHHLVIDAASWLQLLAEIGHLYPACCAETTPVLPPLAGAYRDYVTHESAVLQDKGEKLGTYWQTRLAELPLQLALPTDQPRPAWQRFNGSSEFFALAPELTAALNALAKQEKVTLYAVLLAAFQVLLQRYAQQDRFVVGVPSSNRPAPAFAATVGNFINILPIAADLSENPPFKTQLQQVWRTLLMGLKNQAYPFPLLVKALQLPHSPALPPLVQVLFSFPQTTPELAPFLLTIPGAEADLQPLAWGELLITPFALPQQDGGFDLGLEMVQDTEKCVGVFKYNPDLFHAATIQRLATHFQTLLAAIVADPNQRVTQLPILTTAEHEQIVHTWNDTAVDFGPPQTIHALFEQQVKCTPEAVALVLADEQLSYATLNARANQLAHYLLELGVQTDTLVVVIMERSVEMVVSLLAVLKAGGAYVPIDPTYPRARIRYMLTDSGAPILLTQSHLMLDDEAVAGIEHIIHMDSSGAHLAAQCAQNPQTLTTPADLAYVIYTSGSTGQPKGVLIEHGGAFNVAKAQAELLPALSTGSRLLHLATLGFDAATAEIMMALLHGVTLVIAPAQHERIGPALAHLLASQRITHVTLVPSALQTLPMIELPDLQVLIVAGEACPDHLVARWAGTRAFFNFYGPTESPIWTTSARLQAGQAVHIGRPIANRRVYILAADGALLPVGVPGELHIGGEQLARGYLNQPELTAARFIEHPLLGRLYKTGDLCRWRPDGNPSAGSGHCIEYLGRTDFQVKLHGFRIELGEIERALLAHADVREAVVLVREDAADKRLVAYLVGQVDGETLRQHLAERLPAHMVPAAFVTLAAMPLTPNGKLDRRALPAPDYAAVQTAFVAPRNEIEAALAQAFAAVLRIPQVGIHDNFFRLGGDSILSIGVTSRAAQQGYTISVNALFQAPTVAQLAAVIQANDTAGPPQVLAPQEVQSGAAGLLPMQRWFLAANQPTLHHFNQSFLLTVKQPIHPAQLEAAIGVLLNHHDALRFQYTQTASGWQQQYLVPSAAIPLNVVDLPLYPEEQRAVLEAISSQTQASLNPLTGDLVRFVYFQAGGGNSTGGNRLLIAIHHLAVDGVSWRILLEDLTTLLDGGQLPPKTSSYRNWSAALQSATAQGRFDAQISEWLTGFVETPLPLAEPGAPNTMGNSHQLTVTLSATQTEQLLRTLPDLHAVTLDAVLLTALTATIAEWAGQRALRIKFESYGRQALVETINLNRTVGWFTSAYPLTLPRFTGSAVKRLRYTLEQLRRVTDGGISFGALHDFHPDAAIRAQFAALPIAPVVYNYLGQLDSLENARFGVVAAAAGLSVAPDFQRDTLIDSNALVINGQLRINWTVSPQIRREQAEALLATFTQTVDQLLRAALQSTEQVAIPSDFVDADLALEQLEALCTAPSAPAIATIYSLSPMQAGMLFHSRLAPGQGTYIEHNLFHVADPAFVVTRFVQAIQVVIDHHDSLRAAFPFQQDGEAVQVIYQRAPLPVTVLDWRALAAEVCQMHLADLIEADRLTDFVLSDAPLLRLTIIQRAQNAHDLLLTFHHALMDRWSVDRFWAAVLRVYAGQPLPQTTPYQAYIHHLRQQPADPTFWRDYLRGFYAPTPLPGLTTPTPAQGQPASLTQTFTQEATAQLTAFAREQGLTLNILFQATWALLLARYTRETDIVFGTVTSGRTAPIAGIEAMVGLFINTLPCRVQFADAVTGLGLLQQVAQSQLDLQQREHTPLVDVQRWSELPPGTALFDTLLLFQNTPQNTDQAGGAASGLALQPGGVEPGDTGYALVALVAPGETTTLVLNYDAAQYRADTVARLLTHWQQLVMSLVFQPAQPVLQLPMLAAAEYQQLVQVWSNPTKAHAVDFGVAQTIHARFEQQAATTPDAVALWFEEEQLTYAQLNARANQLAHHLIARGVKPDTLVAVVMERSLELVVSLLAILKAGGAYVPIDPTYPSERIAFTLQDCGTQLVLTEAHLLDDLPAYNGQYLFVSDDRRGIYPATNPVTATTAQHLAYVIYTSGSTGQPKGALITHANVWRLFAATDAWFGFNAGDVWSLFHSFAFDFSVWEMWGALLYGGRLVIVPYQVSRDPSAFYHLLCAQGVTVLNQTPSAFRQLIAVSTQARQPHALRTVIFGGEALEFERLRPWFAQHGDTRPQLVNMYGITETTVHVTYQPITAGDLDQAQGRSRIGQPLLDLQLYILDVQAQPVPIGVAGELYVAGAGLARGYLNRPELTAARFIHHPQLGRLYKTGDLCRWLADGNIEYLGRTDFQVKIRGFRIELGEIEQALLSQPGVREAVALVREDHPGDKRIVAYLVGGNDSTTLRQSLAQRLPEYMVPAAFVWLDVMPLTANGKLDRHALPAPDDGSVARATVHVAPKTPLQTTIATVWAKALAVEQVGLYDNFFDLGGHSLLVIQICDELKVLLQRPLAVVDLFRHPTINELAHYLAQGDDNGLRNHTGDEDQRIITNAQDRVNKQKDARTRRRQLVQQQV